jgi:hypothetical protein
MNAQNDYLFWLSDAEFRGKSLNGPSLIETLRSLSAAEATSTDTYEGYTAWGVALHVLWFKHLVGRALDADLPPYPHEESGWPALPEDLGEESYKSMIAELEASHDALMKAVRGAPERLADPMPRWNMPIGQAFAWVVAHDTNHNTQIRNMGLASLKER